MNETRPPPTPTLTAEAIKKAVLRLYCCEDLSVIGKLGSGFYANVYLVHHFPSKLKMAMKLSSAGNVQRREIEILSSLRHENVQRLYGACIIGGKLGCLTEYANGGSLVDLLTSTSAPLPWNCRISLAHDIILGLGHLHEHQLIHRDLSAQNILIRVNTVDCSHLHYHHRHHETPPRSSWPSNASTPMGSTSRGSSGLSSPFSDEGYDGGGGGGVGEMAGCGGGDFLATSSPSPSTVPIDELFVVLGPASHPIPSPLVNIPKVSPLTVTPDVMQKVCRRGGCLGGQFPYTAIVSDLGVCLDLRQPNVDATVTAGNAYCTAPECLQRIAPYSPAADIFAYGLLICELITRQINNGSSIPRTSDYGLDLKTLPVPPDCPPWFLQLAADCCSVERLQRPTVAEILTRLEIGCLIDQNLADTHSSSLCPRALTLANGSGHAVERTRTRLLGISGGPSVPPATLKVAVQPDCLS